MHPQKWDYWSLSTITFIDLISNFSLRFLWGGAPNHTACGIFVPQPGIESRSQQWKCWFLTTEPLGNSHLGKLLSVCKILFAHLSHCPANLVYIILFIYVYITYNKEYLLWTSPLMYFSVALCIHPLCKRLAPLL